MNPLNVCGCHSTIGPVCNGNTLKQDFYLGQLSDMLDSEGQDCYMGCQSCKMKDVEIKMQRCLIAEYQRCASLDVVVVEFNGIVIDGFHSAFSIAATTCNNHESGNIMIPLRLTNIILTNLLLAWLSKWSLVPVRVGSVATWYGGLFC